MSTARLTADEIQKEADFYRCDDHEEADANEPPDISWGELNEISQALQQAASDARVIAQLRAWLAERLRAVCDMEENSRSDFGISTMNAYRQGGREELREAIAELDRLSRPAGDGS